MPINLVKPLKEIASMDATLKKQAKEDKPKEMTEYQKEKVKIAKKNQELKSQSLAQKQISVESVKSKEERFTKKQELQEKRTQLLERREERLSKISPITSETAKIKAQADLQNAKNQELREKRLLQNSKNREKKIKAQQKLYEEVDSITTTNKNSRSSLGILKTSPQKLGFNIFKEGGVEDE